MRDNRPADKPPFTRPYASRHPCARPAPPSWYVGRVGRERDPAPEPRHSRLERAADRLFKLSRRLDRVGRSTTRVGLLLTVYLTLPIVGALLLGTIGFVVGLAIALLVALGRSDR